MMQLELTDISNLYSILFALGIYIENLTEYVCHTPLDVFELLKMGQRKLIFAETKMNRRSSRYCIVYCMKILTILICF